MNKFRPYVDTHIHSYYSLLDGVSSPAKNVERAKSMGAPAVAITDHGFVSGVYEHYFACKEQGLKPLLGCEFYMRESLEDDKMKYYHGVFIAMNKKGFENLLFLCSLGCSDNHWKERRPVLSFQEIFDHSEGLMFSTGCMLGILGTAQKRKNGEKKNGKATYEDHSEVIEEVNQNFLKFKAVFGDRMFVEIGPAKVTHDWKGIDKGGFQERETKQVKFGPIELTTNCLQEYHNRRAILMAKVHNLPIIVASDAHMCNPKLKSIQDLLMMNAPDNYNGFHFHQTHAMIPSDELWAEFQKNHPYVDEELFRAAIDNTHKFSDMIEDITLDFPALVPKFPMKLLGEPVDDSLLEFFTKDVEKPSPQYAAHNKFWKRYKDIYTSGMTSRQFMMALINKIGRLPNDVVYMERLKEELSVICDNGVTDYTDYFLILADIVLAAMELGVGVGPARGSAGGCLLSYLLGITAIDPIKYDLSFVRFLNVGRLKAGHPPDIDTDFTDRDPIVDYIFNIYGKDHVAMVGAFQTIKTKAALKDIVRSNLHGHLPNDHIIHKICRDIDSAPQYYPSEKSFVDGFDDDDGHHHPGLRESNKALDDFLKADSVTEGQLYEILETPRHLSKHAGGVVITPVEIDRVIPTQHWQNAKCTQIGFKTVEKIGGLKIDILGVNTLNFIWGAVKLIQERHGVTLDPWGLPVDQEVFDMLRDGDTSTVFQFDTSVVRPFLAQIAPKSVSDLILITSVARPGGLDSKLEDGGTVADHFIARSTGQEPVDYLDPLLEPILSETYGLVIFQEQIQKIFEVVGGLTPVESDDARRAVGKKNLKVLLSIKGQLFDGARVKYGWSLEKCEALWNSFIGAANYAFNRAHAAAYGIIAYACAYFKKKYPLEWWCAVLAHSESDKVRHYLSEIESFMQFPSVNNSAARWVIGSNGKLVPPLTLVTGVGDKAVEEIKNKGPFSGFADYMAKIDKRKVNKVATERLIWAGCFADIEHKDDPNELMKAFLLSRKDIKTPEEYKDLDRVELIKRRSQLLSVASYDYVKVFEDTIKGGKRNGSTTWQYDYDAVNKFHKVDGYPVLIDSDDFELFVQKNPGWEKPVVFIGMFSTESKMFYYTDKKSGDRVGAYKLFVENNRKIVESVLWPKLLEKADKVDFEDGSILAIYGYLRFSSFKKALELAYIGHKRLL